jgi:hypothetical protein
MNRYRFIVVSLVGIFFISLAFGQWSEPTPVFQPDSTWLDEPRLICTRGDTLWVVYIEGTRTPYPGWKRICASWSLGDTWSESFDITGRDSLYWTIYIGLGFGADPNNRLWLSWYRGNAYTFQEDSWAICTAMRDSVWHPFQKSICPFYGWAAKSLTADRQGNWYMAIQKVTSNPPGDYSSAMYSKLEGDTWVAPGIIAEGTSHPAQSSHYCPTLVTHANSGIWAVNDFEDYWAHRSVYVHLIRNDSVFELHSFRGESSVATADSAGRLWVLFNRDTALRSVAIVDTAIVNLDIVCSGFYGPAGVCTDPEGWVWVLWGQDSIPVVSYNRGNSWSQPEQVADSVGYPRDIVSDSRGRIYVLLWLRNGNNWGLYSIYREYRPGILNTKSLSADQKLPFVTINKNILKLNCNESSVLLDIAGRKRVNLKPGLNNIQAIPAGVYFIKSKNDKDTKKIIIQH